jgi:preprotein translocase subunit Sec61beta
MTGPGNAQHAVVDDGRGMRCLVRFWPSSSRMGAVEVEPGFVVGALILIFALLIIFDD